jgi:hypothetical protein
VQVGDSNKIATDLSVYDLSETMWLQIGLIEAVARKLQSQTDNVNFTNTELLIL